MKLLTKSNPKLLKGNKLGFRTVGLHFLPSILSGRNVCAKATPGCAAACLNTAGMGIFDSVQKSRLRKTNFFFENRKMFMFKLEKEIKFFVWSTKRLARRKHKKIIPAIRLNTTSDIKWENISFVGKDGRIYKNMMERFPNVQFYDYTKHPIRKNLPPNYHLTFSLAETNEQDAKQALDNKLNIAVVYTGKMPKRFWDRKTIDGDKHDLRFLDNKNSIVMLKAKGRARHDITGFVKHLNVVN